MAYRFYTKPTYKRKFKVQYSATGTITSHGHANKPLLDTYDQTNEDISKSIASANDPLLTAYAHSGIIDWDMDAFAGDIVAIDIDTTKFNLAEFRVGCVTFDDDGNKVRFIRTVPAQTLTATNRMYNVTTWIGYNWVTDTIIQQSKMFQRDDMTNIIQLGRLAHYDYANINTAYTRPLTIETELDLAGEVNSYGTLRIGKGFVITPNGANLKFNCSGGMSQCIGANSLKRHSINYPITPESVAPIFAWGHKGAANNAVFEGEFDYLDTVNREDGAGGITPITDNTFSNLYLAVFPYREIGIYIMHRSKHEYATLQDAELGHISDLTQLPDGTEDALLLCGISYKKGIADLEDAINTGLASISTPSTFGSITTVQGYAQTITRSFGLTDLGNSGVHFIAGFYTAAEDAVVLTQDSAVRTYGAANNSYEAPAFIVAGGAGTVDAGQIELRVVGTSKDGEGVLKANDYEILCADITTLSLNQRLKTTKEWLGEVSFRLEVASGVPTTYSAQFNYGFARPITHEGKDFVIQNLRVVGHAAANDAEFDIRLFHDKSEGWIFHETEFGPGWLTGDANVAALNPAITSVLARLHDDQDDGTTIFDKLTNGQPISYKKRGMSHFISGSDGEGYVLVVKTKTNNSVKIGTVTTSVRVQTE